jgi:predicted RNA-binding protein with RPS1 domain
MDFASYLGRARAFDSTGLTPDAARKLGRLFDRGVAVPEVVASWTTELGGHSEANYRLAREIWQEHRQWRQALLAVSARRSAAGLVVLPDEVVQRTWDEDELAVLERGAERLMALRARSHGTWTDALLAVADARAAVLGAALSGGLTRLAPERDEVPARTVAPEDWLAACHEAAEGWPLLSALDGGVAAAVKALAASLLRLDESLDTAAIAQELVVGDLEATTRRALYRRAIVALAASASTRVAQRLAARPAAPSRALGLYVGAPGCPSAAAVVTRDGGAPKTHVAEPVDGPVSALAFLMEHARGGDAWVFPEHAPDPEGLAAALDALPEEALLLRMAADGLPEAAPGPAGSAPASRAAVALARRALEPERAWRALPADAGWFLPPGVCLSKSDAERMAERVAEALAAVPASASRTPSRSGSPAKAAAPAERARRAETTPRSRPSVSGTVERPNPGLERLSDLEAGMRLRGHVASLNRYGAFVDVGLPKEGLVPIQALTGGAGGNPGDVVVNGQSVEVRVLSVDAGRGRFELALEAVHDFIRPPPGRQRSDGRGKPNGQRSGRPRSGGSSRRGRG